MCLGLDGGQSKLIATLAIIPQNEKDKKGRMAEDLVKNRSKSTSAKRCLVVGRIDAVPENRTNITFLKNTKTVMKKLSARNVTKNSQPREIFGATSKEYTKTI